MRLPRTSDHRPAAILPPIASTWVAASTAAAELAESPRRSCRKSTAKPPMQSCGAIRSALPIDSRQIALSRNGPLLGKTESTSAVTASACGPSRITRPPITVPARQARPSVAKPHSTPPLAMIAGRASETAKPLRGIAVCRMPRASPRRSGGNQCRTARPLAD